MWRGEKYVDLENFIIGVPIDELPGYGTRKESVCYSCLQKLRLGEIEGDAKDELRSSIV